MQFMIMLNSYKPTMLTLSMKAVPEKNDELINTSAYYEELKEITAPNEYAKNDADPTYCVKCVNWNKCTCKERYYEL